MYVRPLFDENSFSGIETNWILTELQPDPKIALGWLNTPENLRKPFVRSRVVEIQELTAISNWHYVPTTARCIS